MKTISFFVNLLLLVIGSMSLENSTILSSTIMTSTLRSTNITNLENSNTTTTAVENISIDFPVNVLSGDFLLDPNLILSRATRNLPSHARKHNGKEIIQSSRNKRYSNYGYSESGIIPYYRFEKSIRGNDQIKRSHTRIFPYPVFPGK